MSFHDFLNDPDFDDTYGPDTLTVRYYFKNWVETAESSAMLPEVNLSVFNIHTIPPLPDSITKLTVGNDYLVYIPQSSIPKNLESFSLRKSPNVRRIPAMPNSLKNLAISNNRQINKLPSLPVGIKHISASGTNITTVQWLYTGIVSLTLSGCPVRKLPFKHMPSTLKFLDISGTHITVLPNIGCRLEYLNISNTKITVLPPFPISLTTLFCHTCHLVIPSGDIDLRSLEKLREYGMLWLEWHSEKQKQERQNARFEMIKIELLQAFYKKMDSKNMEYCST
jgi:hypothetical protein